MDVSSPSRASIIAHHQRLRRRSSRGNALSAHDGDISPRLWDVNRGQISIGFDSFPPLTAGSTEPRDRNSSLARQDELNKYEEELRAEIEKLREKLKTERYCNQQSIAENVRLMAHVELLEAEQEELNALLGARSGTGVGRQSWQNAAQRNLDDENRRRRAAANTALIGGVNYDDEAQVFTGLQGKATGRVAGFLQRISKAFSHHRPFARDVAVIHAHYGSSVAAYFIFYRWLITTYIIAAVAVGVWMLVHVIYKSKGTSGLQGGVIGLIPTELAYSSFTSAERIVYGYMITSVTALFVFEALNKWLREDKVRQRLLLVDEEQRHVKFSKSVFLSWDNSLTSDQEVEDLRHSQGMQYMVLMQEADLLKGSANRTRRERIILLLRRITGMLIYMGLQLCAWFAIIALTSQSQELGAQIQSKIEYWNNPQLSSLTATFSTSIVPAAVTVINAVMPMAIKAITNFEMWDEEKIITYMLASRMYLAKILNAVIQALSFFLLADPYLLADNRYSNIRRNVQQEFDAIYYTNRMDQVSAGLFQLVVTEFVASKVLNFAMPNISRLIARARGKQWIRGEFEVAKVFVSLLYFEALAVACFPFFPASIIFIALFMVVSFKGDVLLLMKYNTKPQKPWAAHDAGSFFIKLLLATYFFGVGVLLMFLTGTTFPKTCTLQDITPQLCSLDTADQVPCAMNPSNKYYEWFSAPETGCEAYPNCVCDGSLASGPFVDVESAWQSLKSNLENFSPFRLLLDYPLLAWLFGLIAYMGLLFKRNAFDVASSASDQRQMQWTTDRNALEAQLRKQSKQISKLQVQAGVKS